MIVRARPSVLLKLQPLFKVSSKDSFNCSSIIGVVAFIANKMFGIGIPENELVIVIVFVIGLFAADSKKAQ